MTTNIYCADCDQLLDVCYVPGSPAGELIERTYCPACEAAPGLVADWLTGELVEPAPEREPEPVYAIVTLRGPRGGRRCQTVRVG